MAGTEWARPLNYIMNMKKHFALTCLGYVAFTVSMFAEMFGIKLGWGLYPTLAIYLGCLLFFITIVFTSMQKVKDALKDK